MTITFPSALVFRNRLLCAGASWVFLLYIQFKFRFNFFISYGVDTQVVQIVLSFVRFCLFYPTHVVGDFPNETKVTFNVLTLFFSFLICFLSVLLLISGQIGIHPRSPSFPILKQLGVWCASGTQSCVTARGKAARWPKKFKISRRYN